MKRCLVLCAALSTLSLISYDFCCKKIIRDNNSLYVVNIPWPTDDSQENWNIFSFCSHEITVMLQDAQEQNMPFFLAIPECYHESKTTGRDAAIIEGSRVALAWVSIFHRFFNLNAYIIPTTSDTRSADIIASCNQQIITKKNQTPEQSIISRILPIKKNNSLSDYTIQDSVPVSTYKQEHIVLSPELPSLQEKQKRILITGGAGFIGSHLTERFLADGHQVIVLDNFACCSPENIKSIHNKNLWWADYDVTHPFALEGPLDLIVHLASYPSPADYYHKPIETMRTGLHGTSNCLALAQEKNARFLLGSTSEVYGDPHIHPQPEYYAGNVDPIGKRSQYDQSKRGAETWCKYYFDSYGLDIRMVRIFNTYGPRMRLGDGRVVTNFIKAVLENKEITIYGDGLQTRSFGYVDDTVDGIYRVATLDSINNFKTLDERIFNVGNAGEFTINDVAQQANKISEKYLHKKTEIKHIPQFDPSDPKIRRPDLTRIQTVTGYQPLVSLEMGFEKTFNYFNGKK